MPFESEAQRAWMYANEPEMAKRWEKHTPKGKKLPKRKKKEEKDAEAESPLQALLRAKAYSDARNYAAKQALMRKLIRERQEEFEIDSDKDGIVGLTHGPTGFRMHLPKSALTGFDLATQKVAELSQEDIYKALKASLPRGTRHASGGIPDTKGLSDVDLALLSKHPHALLGLLPEGTTQASDDRRSIYTIPGYDREVNLYATADKDLASKAVRHRKVEVLLRKKFPQLYEQARQAKVEGLGTEPAWAKVLGLDGDPYEAMLDKDRVLGAAAGLKTAAMLTPEQEQAIISKYYGHSDQAHGYDGHVAIVRERARSLADRLGVPEPKKDILDVAALLHDITRHTDKADTHELTGAEEAANIEEVRKALGARKLKTVQRMIKNHRASTGGGRFTLLDKILRDADRTAARSHLGRAALYRDAQGANREESLRGAIEHIFDKYGPSGYGYKSLHFPESREDTEKEVQELREANRIAEETGDQSKLWEIAKREPLVLQSDRLMGREEIPPGEKVSNLTTMAPKWSERDHIMAALRQHMQDAQGSLDTDKEQKELTDLGLILDAYSKSQMQAKARKSLLAERLAKFQQYADAPSLGVKTANRAIPDCIDVDWSDREAKGSRNPNDVLWDIPQPNIYIQESKQHGKGTHAAKTIKKGDYACIGLVGMKWRTPACRYINHSPDNNVELEWNGKLGMFKATQDIKPGEELLLDYRELPWYELTVKAAEEKPKMGIIHEVSAELIKKGAATGDASSQGFIPGLGDMFSGIGNWMSSTVKGFGQYERPLPSYLQGGTNLPHGSMRNFDPNDPRLRTMMATGQLPIGAMSQLMARYKGAPGDNSSQEEMARHQSWKDNAQAWQESYQRGKDYDARAANNLSRQYAEMSRASQAAESRAAATRSESAGGPVEYTEGQSSNKYPSLGATKSAAFLAFHKLGSEAPNASHLPPPVEPPKPKGFLEQLGRVSVPEQKRTQIDPASVHRMPDGSQAVSTAYPGAGRAPEGVTEIAHLPSEDREWLRNRSDWTKQQQAYYDHIRSQLGNEGTESEFYNSVIRGQVDPNHTNEPGWFKGWVDRSWFGDDLHAYSQTQEGKEFGARALRAHLAMNPEARGRFQDAGLQVLSEVSDTPDGLRRLVEIQGKDSPDNSDIAYLNDLVSNDERVQKAIGDRVKAQLKNDGMVFFDGKPMSVFDSLKETLGPGGMVGGAMFLFGLLGGSKAFMLSGLAALGGFGAWRASQATDENFWRQALNPNAPPELRRRAHALLSMRNHARGVRNTVREGWQGLTGGGAEKKSSVSSWAGERAPVILRLAEEEKRAAFAGGGRLLPGAVTRFGTGDRSSDVEQRLQQHFPAQYARETVARDPNISFADKVKIVSAVNEVAGGPQERGAVKVRDFLPALIGAGVGYAGATAVGSMLGLSPSMDKAIRAAGAVVGGLLNEPKVRW